MKFKLTDTVLNQRRLNRHEGRHTTWFHLCNSQDQIKLTHGVEVRLMLVFERGRAGPGMGYQGSSLESWLCSLDLDPGWLSLFISWKVIPFYLQELCPSIMYDTPQFLYKCDDTIPVEICWGHAEPDRGGKRLHSEGAAWISQHLLAGVTWDTISGCSVEGIRTEGWLRKNLSNWGTFLEHKV